MKKHFKENYEFKFKVRGFERKICSKIRRFNKR